MIGDKVFVKEILGLRSMKVFLFIGCFVFVTLSALDSQSGDPEKVYLEVTGVAEHNRQPMSGVIINLYEGNNKVDSKTTGSSGHFSFILDFNKYYSIEFTKSGFVSKRIDFDTEVPEDIKTAYVSEFAMSIVKTCEGVDVSAFSDPVDKISFNKRSKEFESDKSYMNRQRMRFQDVYFDLEECYIKKYEDLIDEADRLTKQDKFDEAAKKYNEAMTLQPDNRYPRDQIEKISERAEKNEENDRMYDKAIAEGDALLAQERLDEAKQQYERALNLKPGEGYPREKIKSIDTQQSNKQRQNSLNNQYNSLIARANDAFTAKKYSEAKTIYHEALTLQPSSAIAKGRVQELDALIAREQQQQAKQEEQDRAYNQTVQKAEALLAKKQYEAAKETFNKALSMRPEAAKPLQKIDQIDEMIAEQKRAEQQARQEELEREFNAALAMADGHYKNKNYTDALDSYKKALSLKPSDTYTKQRIDRVNGLIAAQQAEKERELAAREAEKQREIAEREAEEQREMAAMEAKEQQRKEQGYNNAVANAQSLFNTKQYVNAKNSYEEALTYKPGDPVATSKIREIELLIKEKKEQQGAEQAKNKQYNEMIANADNMFNERNYTAAKQAYESALRIKPGEVHPQNRISEIERLVADQQRKLDRQQKMENDYKAAVSKADGLFRMKEYEEALTEYNNALAIKPGEQYPSGKISEIKQLLKSQQEALAEARQKKENYRKLIVQADQLFDRKDYEQAKSYYNQALAYQPGESYPKQQIAEIDGLLAQAEKQKQEQLAVQREYETTIAAADNAFDKADYKTAKSGYQDALNIKAGEAYPRQRIKQIDEITSLLAKQQNTQQTRQPAARNKAASSKLVELEFKNDDERDRYLDKLKKDYPDGVTLEIYKEEFRTIRRYIVIRDNVANEFREVKYSWGTEHFQNGKLVNSQFFKQQTSKRSGEYFKETSM